jgi:ATP-dependent DNA helicase RecG
MSLKVHCFKIFDNRIVFTNPGRLYGKLCLADLEHDDYVSSISNRLLAEVFYLTGDIKKYGTGFVRIREFLQEYPEIALIVEEIGDFLKVELRIAEQVTTQVSNLLKVLDKPLSRQELQEKLGLRNREHFRQSYLRPDRMEEFRGQHIELLSTGFHFLLTISRSLATQHSHLVQTRLSWYNRA